MAHFNPYVDKIDIDFWRDVCVREGSQRTFRRGELFLRAGELPRYFGFIESGYFVYTVIDSAGCEHVTGFALRNNLAADYYSSIHGVAALCNLRATCTSTVSVISQDRFRAIIDSIPGMRLVMVDVLFRTAHQRYLNLYRQSPKERYMELLARCPDILQHITLRELASYLQITPTHLSRIRKEILSGE